MRDRAVLFVSNHVSWVDILVIGSIPPVAFVAKSEVRKWPLVGITAKMQRTVFVDRARRHQAADAVNEIVKRLAERHLGGAVRGRHIERRQPRAAVPLGAGRRGQAKRRTAELGILIQPMSICYTGLHGIPMGRQHRPLVAWYGDLDFMPHIKEFIERGAVDAVVSYGEPMAADGEADRKAMAKTLEGAVRAITAATLRGRPKPAHAGRMSGSCFPGKTPVVSPAAPNSFRQRLKIATKSNI